MFFMGDRISVTRRLQEDSLQEEAHFTVLHTLSYVSLFHYLLH